MESVATFDKSKKLTSLETDEQVTSNQSHSSPKTVNSDQEKLQDHTLRSLPADFQSLAAAYGSGIDKDKTTSNDHTYLGRNRFASLPVSSSKEGLAFGFGAPQDVEQLKKDYKKLCMKVKYMDNLGVLVTDFKQENEHLTQENLKLRKRLEELEEMAFKSSSLFSGKRSTIEQVHERLSSLSASDQENESPFEIISSESHKAISRLEELTSAAGTTTTSLQSSINRYSSSSSDQQGSVTDPEQQPNEEIEEKNPSVVSLPSEASEPVAQEQVKIQEDAEQLPENESNDSTSKNRYDTRAGANEVSGSQIKKMIPPTESVSNDQSNFNEQIRQLEEMFGIRNPSPESSDVTISMTSQFAKIAAVFASLSQRIVQSQKKARNSQAFCDALMAENQKMKRLLKEAYQQVETLKSDNEQLKNSPPLVPSTSKTSPSTVTDVKQTASTSKDSSSGTESTSGLILKLQARVKKLELQRAEILRVNKSWDTQYKCLKRELDRRTGESEEAAGGKQTEGGSKDQRRKRDLDVLLAAAKREIQSHIQEKAELTRNYASAHAQCIKLKNEVAHQRDTQRKLKSDKSCLQAENQRLNQALEAAYSIHERRSLSIRSDDIMLTCGENHSQRNPRIADDSYNMLTTSDHFVPGQETRETASNRLNEPNALLEDLRTQTEVLQQQVKIYREDFETERRDREKSQGEKQRLEELLTMARHEVQALSQQVCTHEQDFRQERREKERLQRQLHRWQNTSRDPTGTRLRDRYDGELNDPPAYYAHRFQGNDDTSNVFNRATTRRRSRPSHYLGGHNNRPGEWYQVENIDNDAVLSYPPVDVL